MRHQAPVSWYEINANFVSYWDKMRPWYHDDVIKWKHFPRYWTFVRGTHQWPVNSSHKGQWRGALMFPLICARRNSWANNRDAGDLRRHHAHYDVTVISSEKARQWEWPENGQFLSIAYVYFISWTWSAFLNPTQKKKTLNGNEHDKPRVFIHFTIYDTKKTHLWALKSKSS